MTSILDIYLPAAFDTGSRRDSGVGHSQRIEVTR